MAQITYRALWQWLQEIAGVTVLLLINNYQKYITVIDFDYYRVRMYFFFGFVYLSLMIINYYLQIEKKNIEIKILKKKLNAISEVDKFYSSRNAQTNGGDSANNNSAGDGMEGDRLPEPTN